MGKSSDNNRSENCRGTWKSIQIAVRELYRMLLIITVLKTDGCQGTQPSAIIIIVLKIDTCRGSQPSVIITIVMRLDGCQGTLTSAIIVIVLKLDGCQGTLPYAIRVTGGKRPTLRKRIYKSPRSYLI